MVDRVENIRMRTATMGKELDMVEVTSLALSFSSESGSLKGMTAIVRSAATLESCPGSLT